MTKSEYLDIRNDSSRDVMPVLHYFHNSQCANNQAQLTFYEFKLFYSEWLKNPLVLAAHSAIITRVFALMDKQFGLC